MKNKKAYSLLIWLLSLFIFVFFTTNIYSNYITNSDLKKELENKLETLNKQLQELNLVKNNKDNLEIKRFLQDFNEAEIFNYINEYIEQVNKANNDVVIEFGSINFSEAKKSEIWFKEIDITLNLNKVNDINNLKSILDYLTNKNNKYNFFITDFSFPIEKTSWYKNISIPLKMFIK